MEDLLVRSFDCCPIAALIVKDRKILYLNKSAENLFNVNKEQVTNQSTNILYSSFEDFELFGDEVYTAIKKEKQIKKIFIFKDSSSRRFHAEVFMSLIEENEGIYLILFQELEETQKLKQELEYEKDKYHQIFDNNVSIKLIIDCETGQVLEANKSAIKFYGYNKEEFKNINIRDINILSEEEIKKEMELAACEKRIYFNFRHKLKNGDIKDVEVFSGPIQLKDKRVLFSIVNDITEKKEFLKNLLLSSQVFNDNIMGILISDAENKIINVNEAFSNITGFEKYDVIGKKPNILSSGVHTKEFYREMWKKILKEGYWKGEVWNKRKDGSIYPESLTISTHKDKETNKILNFIGIFSDKTEQKKQENQIKYLAEHDSLTGLLNRNQAKSQIEEILQKELYGSIIYLDLDGFKEINDGLGHANGDQVLCAVATRLRQFFNESNMYVGRIGGDEFVVILIGLDKKQELSFLCEGLLEEISKPYEIEEMKVNVSTSIGVAMLNEQIVNADEVLKNADLAMYNSKKKGKNRYSFFEEDLAQKMNERFRIANSLKQSISNNYKNFEVFYQAQVELSSNQVIGLEALLRWKDDELGSVSPTVFIGVAEEQGFIDLLSQFVLDKVIHDYFIILKQGFDLEMAINISPMEFLDKNFMRKLTEKTNKHNFPKERLELEITESIFLNDNLANIEVINNLQKEGFSIALDDFGTGYSSLNYLKKLKINKLKIDKSFIKDIEKDSCERKITKTIIELAKNLHLLTLAEGVEDEIHTKLLKELGCDIVQGYYFHKPCPLNELLIFLKDLQKID